MVIKFVSSKGIYLGRFARRQMPGGVARWGDARFVFDADGDEADYDWLVVYHDLPSAVVQARCPRENTVFVTHEPSAIKSYGIDFAAQFGWLLSCHEAWALSHPRRIAMQPGSIWIYGGEFYDADARGKYEYDMLAATPPPRKTKMLSTVCSDKAMRHTLNYRRLQFTRRLHAAMPDMDVFGHGVNLIKQKADALDAYRYHLTVENDFCPDYWTEKLADAFLGHTLPFYHGCPNAEKYFPPDSFIRIDINDFAAAQKTIERAIANGEYEKRLPHIVEARRRVLEEHNLYAMLARTLAELPRAAGAGGAALYSRYALMKRNPMAAARHVGRKLYNRWRIGRGMR